MTELFEQYSIIHFNLTESEVVMQIVFPYGEPSVVLISSDFFTFSSDKEGAIKALETAIAQNQLLPNQEG
jgi:hypothetical protein